MKQLINITVIADTTLSEVQITKRVTDIFFDTKYVVVRSEPYSPYCKGCNNPNCKDCFEYD